MKNIQMIKIITDSSSDITHKEAEKLNITVIPLKILFKEENLIQNKKSDFNRFYEKLAACDELPTTSQASPTDYLDLFEDAKKNGDSIILLALSGKLSGTVQSAFTAKQICKYDNIYIIDSAQAVIGLRLLVEYAVKLRDDGKSACEIFDIIDKARHRVVLFGMIDTLKYLQKGGRLSKGSAVVGTMLQIKPIITINDGAIDVIDKGRGVLGSIDALFKLIDKSGEIDHTVPVYYGYSYESKNSLMLKEKADKKYEITNSTDCYPIGGVVGTHIGPGAIAICYLKKE